MKVLRFAGIPLLIGAACVIAGGLLSPAAAQSARPFDDWNVASSAMLTDRANVLPNSPVLIKSLGDAAEIVTRWVPPTDADAWSQRRPEVARDFARAIGLATPPERTPLNVRVVGQHNLGDYVIENVLFESRPGFLVTANLYRQASATPGKRRPAVLCPIGHHLSDGKATPNVQARCIQLAQMGFIVLVYDAIGQGERLQPGNIHHDAGYALLPLGETIAGWMVWDSMRAIDYLVTRDDVDADHIGMTGNSGGGLNTLFTAAIDDRVRAAAIVGFTFEFGNWLKYGGTHCTCTHLPGLFRHMQWFEIAGLIAPRAVLMLHGERDVIFPIVGARQAAHDTEAIYALVGQSEQARFVELAGQPHAYSQPYREHMYGWMAWQLQGIESGQPMAEGPIQPLPVDDPRLRCDPQRQLLSKAPTVVDLVRNKALEVVSTLPSSETATATANTRQWVETLCAPPTDRSHYLVPQTSRQAAVPGGHIEKVSYLSEVGQSIPGLLWLPVPRDMPARAVIVVDSRGKAAVAESGLVEPLLDAGFAVFSVDLRGRGETLGHYGPRYDTNFRLLANQILLGQPLAGRRALDLKRAVDYLALRPEVDSDRVAVVGIGDDAFPALLAAASDNRIGRLVVAQGFHSFISPMRARIPGDNSLAESWNDPQLQGRVAVGDYDVDFGSVVPSALHHADIADLVALVAPRKVLFCEAQDNSAADFDRLASRFQQLATATDSYWLRYVPAQSLHEQSLVAWLAETTGGDTK